MNRDIGPGESCGLLLGADTDKYLHSAITEIHREAGHWDTVFATTDPGLAEALKSAGFESLGFAEVAGIERFMKL